MKKKIESLITSSNQLAAYLVARGHSFRPINIDDIVKIEITGANLADEVKGFYQNNEIPVQSYLAAFETLRGAVANARRALHE